MPKKSKKGKGKGKGKKGKKGGKKAVKKDATIKAMSTANSRLWEARIDVIEKSRQEYKSTTRQLVEENEAMHNQMKQTEEDTIKVVSYFKHQDHDKENEIEILKTTMKELKKENRKETEKIVDDFQGQMMDLDGKLSEKSKQVELMQSELKQVKEFKRKKEHMQRELDDIKEAIDVADQQHNATINRMKQKFFEEKMRLQQEANQKIEELAEKAHTEAIKNLEESTRSVYKENVRITEVLAYHVAETEQLKKLRDNLIEENQSLKSEKQLNELAMQKSVQQTKQMKSTIKQLQDKVETLEHSLGHVVREFSTERNHLVQTAETENENAKTEVVKLRRMHDLKTREMNRIKKLAKNILDQRTEVERFFLESLEQVKLEIAANRLQYRRDAQKAYNDRMLMAHGGQGDFPKIRTFNKAENSTNSVFQDLESAERLMEVKGKVDITELTWEQKERILRYLFGKMNGSKKKAAPPLQPALPAPPQHSQTLTTDAWIAEDSSEHPSDDATFLTQAQFDPETTEPEPETSAFSTDKLPSILPQSQSVT